MAIGSLKAYKEQRKAILADFNASPELTRDELARQIKDLHAKSAITEKKQSRDQQAATSKKSMGDIKEEADRLQARRDATRRDDQAQEAQDVQRHANVKMERLGEEVVEGNSTVARILNKGFAAQNKALQDMVKALRMLGGVGGGGKGLLGDLFEDYLSTRGGGKVPKGSKIPKPNVPEGAIEGEAKGAKGFWKRAGDTVGNGKLRVEEAATKAKGFLGNTVTKLEENGGTLGKSIPKMRAASAKVMGVIEPAITRAGEIAEPITEGASKAWQATKGFGGRALDGIKSALPEAPEGGWVAGAKSGALKLLSKAAVPLTVGMAGYDEYKLLNDDTKSSKEKSVGTAGIGGGTAGALAIGTLGAEIGTAIAPGIGTAIGGVIGGIGGYFAGSGIAKNAANFLSNTVEKSGIGDTLGRAAAVAMSPFSENARESLVADWKSNVTPILDKTGKFLSENSDALAAAAGPMGMLANSILNIDFNKVMDDLSGKMKDLTKNIEDEKNSVGAAASVVWTGVKQAASTAAATGKTVFSEAANTVTQAGGQAGRQVRAGYDKGGLSGAMGALPRAATDAASGMVAAGDRASTTLAGGARKAFGELSATASNARGIAAGRWTPDELAAIQSGQASGETFRAGKGMDQQTKDKIAATATKYGIDPKDLLAMGQMESGGNNNAISATGAAGIFQFTGDTASRYGVTNRFDPDQNIDAAARLYNDNKKYLVSKGIKPTLDNLYLAHQEGAGGAEQIIKASEGKGQVSPTVARNMGLNVGGGQSVQGFMAANSKALAAASQKVQTYTAPSKDVPAIPPQSNVLAKADATTVVPPGMASKSPLLATVTQPMGMTTSSFADSDTTRTAQATTAPLPTLQPNTPQEVAQVEVTNQPAPIAAPSGNSGGTRTMGTKPTVVASLSDIPAFFPDVSIMPLLLGRV